MTIQRGFASRLNNVSLERHWESLFKGGRSNPVKNFYVFSKIFSASPGSGRLLWRLVMTVLVLGSPFPSLHAENAADEDYPGWELISPETKEKCKSVENISLPPHPQTLEALEGCDANALYYGFSQAPDYTKALACAEANKAYDVLTMLYANGKGVSRNLDIAIHYACKAGWAPAEIMGRVKHLSDLKTGKPPEKEFDFCDDITSGYMMGHCTAIQSRFKEATRENNLHSLMANWTPEERKGFKNLQKAFESFVEERMGEIDVSGTARAMFLIEEENSLKTSFLKILKECTQDKLPSFSTTQYQERDNMLNALYKKVRDKSYPNISGIDKEGIQKTQRAWLKYRNTWVAFGRLKCPNITVDSWKTLLTQERIKELQDLAAIENYDEE